MRIQHNILAMNAYRNYNTNTTALGKNLEKLSSGYRINRAGDDAAGLAISEKMRAQITGLSAAQKNVKDGISLVKTAEGAMQEIHDMLNRMDYLATQSANGTYQDPVDRENLQKEVDALRTEIDRIADSSNFNGLNLLDGSLSKTGGVGKETRMSIAGTGVGALPDVGETLGTDTVLHKTGSPAVKQTAFSVDLHNLQFTNETGKTLTMKIGSDTFTLDTADTGVAAGTALTASDIAAAFAAGKFKDAAGTTMTGGAANVDGADFDVTASGTRITFTQKATDTTTPSGKYAVEISDTAGGTGGYTNKNLTVTNATTPTVVHTAQNAGNPVKYAVDLTGANVSGAGTLTIGIVGEIYEIDITDADIAAGSLSNKIASLLADAINANPPADDATAGKWTASVTGATLTIAGEHDNQAPTTALPTTDITIAEKATTAPAESSVTGDYNVSSTVISSKADATNDRLASTFFDLTADMAADRATIRIGDEKYTFTTDAAKKADAGMVYVGDLDLSQAADLSKAAERLTKAAAANKTYTVGHDGSRISVTENPDYTKADNSQKYDLTTKEGIEKSLGFSKPGTAPKGNGTLTLQIGDTSDSFNQMEVEIGDMHVTAMGTAGGDSIADIDISTQQGAQNAVQVIKDAINYVSSIRGDLGATQNRLEHTANNLSVMAENIQDAESTIRDTDVAEEMMAYTKNNILVQAAQAMLAQANAVPQGVLQLLQ